MDIIQAVNIAKGCIDNASIIKFYSYICIDNNRVITYNGEQAIILKVSGVENISCAIPGDVLTKILNSLPAQGTALEYKAESNSLTITNNKTKIKLVTLPKTDFIFDETYTKGGASTKLEEPIFKAIDSVKDTIDTNKAIVQRHGIFIFPQGNGSVFYSTDGNQLAQFNLSKVKLVDTKTLLPAEFCQLLWSNKEHLLDGTLTINDNYAVAKSKGITLISHVLTNITFPDFEGVIGTYNQKSNHSLKVEVTPDIIEAVERCLLIQASSETKPIDVTISKSNIIFSSKSVYGVMNIPIKMANPSTEVFEVRFNGLFLKSLITNVESFMLSKANIGLGTGKNLIRIMAGIREE